MEAKQIMHPEDAKAIKLLRKCSGCASFAKWFMKMGYERQFKGENLASTIRVSEGYLPELYTDFLSVVDKVGIKEPELYIYNDPVMNAYTYGETNTFIAISNSVLNNMSREEVKGVIAHECGHILCQHTLYNTILTTIRDVGLVLGIINETILAPLYLSLLCWSRKSELSADRCAASVVGEEVFQSVLIKLACGLKDIGNQTDQLKEQGKELEAFKRSSLWNRIQQEYRIAFYSHPQTSTRAIEVDRWKESYNYRHLRSVFNSQRVNYNSFVTF